MPDFTPGPWVIEDYGVGIFSLSGDCSIVDLAEANSDKEKIANARLIAAAPDMYWLLKSVLDGSAFEVDIHGHYIFTTKKAEEFRKILNRIDGKEAES